MGSSGVVCVVHMPLYIRSLYSCTVPLFVRTTLTYVAVGLAIHAVLARVSRRPAIVTGA